jgi:hypothetical protein
MSSFDIDVTRDCGYVPPAYSIFALWRTTDETPSAPTT